MKTWMISTKNNPLGAVRKVAQTLWETANLDMLLLPLNGKANNTGPKLIDDPDAIQTFNPFTPLMPINAAQLVPDLVNTGKTVAAILRPCEIRTLYGMVKHKRLSIDRLLTISVDCLGTLPMDEFKWRAHRKGSPKGLTQEALQFAPQGGIVPYRYRAACQICYSPEATQADINIGVFGLPVRQYLIINIQSDILAHKLSLEDLLPVDRKLISQRQHVVARLKERGRDTRQRIFKNLVGVLPPDIDSLVEPLDGCEDCRECLNNCPICTNEFPHQGEDGKYIREDIMDWLVTCSGCGICEQACPKHLPLTIIFGHIQQQLAEK